MHEFRIALAQVNATVGDLGGNAKRIRAYLDRAKAQVAETTGLPPERVLICCTHTHTGAQTGEDAYTAFLVGRISDAARAGVAPVEIRERAAAVAAVAVARPARPVPPESRRALDAARPRRSRAVRRRLVVATT